MQYRRAEYRSVHPLTLDLASTDSEVGAGVKFDGVGAVLSFGTTPKWYQDSLCGGSSTQRVQQKGGLKAVVIERYSYTTIWVSLRCRYVSRFSSELQSGSSGMVSNGGSPRKYVGVSPRVLK